MSKLIPIEVEIPPISTHAHWDHVMGLAEQLGEDLHKANETYVAFLESMQWPDDLYK